MSDLKGLQLRSLVKESGELELSLAEQAIPEPAPGEIVVKVGGAPINPSDLGLLTGAADLSTAKAGTSGGQPALTFSIPKPYMRAMQPRVGHALPVGNEGAGTVVKAGSSPEAQKLMGRTVAVFGGAMYSQYRTFKAADALVLPEGTTAHEGASCFVNPLTALGMVGTMRLENHKALVHTAAASNLGQMLVKICLEEDVGLVNIVRSPAQVKLLKDIGAKYVVDSSSANFMEELIDALDATGATIAFDAIGGGKLAGQIFTAMEAAAARKTTDFTRYGTDVFKQVYIYGGLDMGPTELTRSFGFTWSLSGWLLMPFLQRVGAAEAQKLRDRVANGLKTTFASHYTKVISLREALDPAILGAYSRRATGEKYLIDPTL